jgi:hypothetical protein
VWDWQSIAIAVGLVGTPWATLTYIVRRIVRGELISRTVHLDRVNDLQRQADQWKAVAELADKRADLRERQLAAIVTAPREVA